MESGKKYSWEPFERYYSEYDNWFYKNKITAENELRLIRKFDIKYPSLEVGVGTGYFSSQLKVDIGIDPSYSMLLKAYKRGIDSVVGVGESMPFRDEVFRTILLIVTICFLSDPTSVLREIYRVLIKGGNLITCIVPRDSSWGKYYLELSKKGHRFYKYAHFYRVDELNRILKSIGFKKKRSLGILSYSPFEEPFREEPSENIFNMGFVCIENYKYS